jgi:hypothetical protein
MIDPHHEFAVVTRLDKSTVVGQGSRIVGCHHPFLPSSSYNTCHFIGTPLSSLMTRLVSATTLLLAWICLSSCWAKKDRNQPQGHRGLLTPYKPGPFSATLSKSDEKLLAAGKPVMKQTMPSEDEAGGGAICVQDIQAPKEAVWSQILDLNSYKGKVPKVSVSKNYVSKRNSDGSNTIKTRMVLGVMPGYSVCEQADGVLQCFGRPFGICLLTVPCIFPLSLSPYQYESYYDHKYFPRESSLTWTLDYDKTSDFEDVSGHWHVEEHPELPEVSRVFYACDIKLNAAVPGPILSYISKAALKQATGWVKREAEKEPGAVPSAEFPVPSSRAAHAKSEAKETVGRWFR